MNMHREQNNFTVKIYVADANLVVLETATV